jgi:hypothetical protein
VRLMGEDLDMAVLGCWTPQVIRGAPCDMCA